MVKEYVFDANAILRYFRVVDAEGGDKVQRLFDLSNRGEASLLMSVINFGEVYYTLLKLSGERSTRQYIKAMQLMVTMIDADQALAIEAATVKHAHKLGYADSFAAALALNRNATLVSADPAFERVGKSLKWLRLPPYISNSSARSRHK